MACSSDDSDVSKGSLQSLGPARGCLVLPVRGAAEVGPGQAEVPVLGGGEVPAGLRRADGQARGLAQLQVEALRGVRVTGHGFAVCVPVFAVLSWN